MTAFTIVTLGLGMAWGAALLLGRMLGQVIAVKIGLDKPEATE